MQSGSRTKNKTKRARVPIEPSDGKCLLRALDSWAETGAFVALRTRAFVLLLWDGSVRTSGALAMNIEDVIDPEARRVSVAKRIVVRPREQNGHLGRTIALSARARRALEDYLRTARDDGWLPAERLRVPLFVSSTPRGAGQRLSNRSAIHSWELFQKSHASDCSRDYELDDVVYTGRLAYAKASDGDIGSLSEHSGISRRWAAEYMHDSKLRPEDVMAKLDKSRR